MTRDGWGIGSRNCQAARLLQFAWGCLFAFAIAPWVQAQVGSAPDLKTLNSRLDARIFEFKYIWTPEGQQSMTDACFKLYDALWYQWEDEAKRYGYSGTHEDFQAFMDAYWKTHELLPPDRQCGFWFADQILKGRQYAAEYARTDFQAHHLANPQDNRSARMLHLLWATGRGEPHPYPEEAAGWLKVADARAKKLMPEQSPPREQASLPAKPSVDPIQANMPRWLKQRQAGTHLDALYAEVRNTFRLGTHYTRVKSAQRTRAGPSEIEVRLLTSFVQCKPCVNLHVSLEEQLPGWLRRKPPFVVLSREFVPDGAGGAKERAQLFYTLESMDRTDLYLPAIRMFANDHKALSGTDPATALIAQQSFVKSHGGDPEKYKQIAQSFMTASRIQRGNMDSRSLYLEALSTPSALVDGTFLIKANDVKGINCLLLLAEALADGQARAKAE